MLHIRPRRKKKKRTHPTHPEGPEDPLPLTASDTAVLELRAPRVRVHRRQLQLGLRPVPCGECSVLGDVAVDFFLEGEGLRGLVCGGEWGVKSGIPEGLSKGLIFGEGLALHLVPQDTDVDENADWGPFGEKRECGEHSLDGRVVWVGRPLEIIKS